MVKRAVGAPSALSQAVIEEMDAAMGKSGRSASEVLAEVEMSRNYYYKRMRGEVPFNTNDIDKLCIALGVDPMAFFESAVARSKAPRLAPVSDPAPSVEDLSDIATVHHIRGEAPADDRLAAKRGRRKADEPHAE